MPIKDFYVPVELPSGRGLDPETIEEIKEERLKTAISRRPRGFRLVLPSLGFELFAADLRADEPTMHITNFSMGRRELCGHGIGSRVLQEAIQTGKRMNPDLDKLTTGWEHISNLNTIAKVLGPENVAARAGRDNYGQGYEKPLEALFDIPNLTRVQWIEATIGPDGPSAAV